MAAYLRIGTFVSGSCLCFGVACLAVACGGEQGSGSEDAAGASKLADEFVLAHNRVRAGVTAPAGYPGTFSPLPGMLWVDALATSARQWAEHIKSASNCKDLVHENRDPGDTSIGENIAGGTVGFLPAAAVNVWANEHYEFTPAYKFDAQYGHYTQIVWRNSIYLGCGVAQCSNGLVVYVCRYSPAGNVEGEQPY
ncbi:MAG TPA: CAP domain-containing protein [Polyangiaceae bacterium]